MVEGVDVVLEVGLETMRVGGLVGYVLHCNHVVNRIDDAVVLFHLFDNRFVERSPMPTKNEQNQHTDNITNRDSQVTLFISILDVTQAELGQSRSERW